MKHSQAVFFITPGHGAGGPEDVHSQGHPTFKHPRRAERIRKEVAGATADLCAKAPKRGWRGVEEGRAEERCQGLAFLNSGEGLKEILKPKTKMLFCWLCHVFVLRGCACVHLLCASCLAVSRSASSHTQHTRTHKREREREMDAHPPMHTHTSWQTLCVITNAHTIPFCIAFSLQVPAWEIWLRLVHRRPNYAWHLRIRTCAVDDEWRRRNMVHHPQAPSSLDWGTARWHC